MLYASRTHLFTRLYSFAQHRGTSTSNTRAVNKGQCPTCYHLDTNYTHSRLWGVNACRRMPTLLGTILFSLREGRDTVLFSTCNGRQQGARGAAVSPRAGSFWKALSTMPAPGGAALRRARGTSFPRGQPRHGGLGPFSGPPPAPPPRSCRPLAQRLRPGPAGSRPKPARCPPFSLSTLRFPGSPPPVRRPPAPPAPCVPAAPREAADGCRPPLRSRPAARTS